MKAFFGVDRARLSLAVSLGSLLLAACGGGSDSGASQVAATQALQAQQAQPTRVSRMAAIATTNTTSVDINFDSLNAPVGGGVVGAPLYAYFASYGIVVVEGPGARLNVQQAAPWFPTTSALNILNMFGSASTLYTGASYTLVFSTP